MVLIRSASITVHLHRAVKMSRIRAHRRVIALLLPALLAVGLFQPTASAQTLGLTLEPGTLAGDPGQAITFNGRITNITGVSLTAMDLFLNFSGYNPSVLFFNQFLGSPDFVLPNNTVSPTVALFSAVIDPTGPTGTYGFTVALQDINDVVSSLVTGYVSVNPPTTTIPEPTTFALLGSGALVLSSLRARRRRQPPSGS